MAHTCTELFILGKSHSSEGNSKQEQKLLFFEHFPRFQVQLKYYIWFVQIAVFLKYLRFGIFDPLCLILGSVTQMSSHPNLTCFSNPNLPYINLV